MAFTGGTPNRTCLFWVPLILLALIMPPAPAEPAEKAPIKVGIIRDLTAAHAEAGRSQRDALMMVYDDVNRAGGIGGHMIKYLIGDEKADPDASLAVAKRFVEVDDVLFLSGTATSGAALAVTKYAAEAGVPVFGHAFSVKLHEPPRGQWYFASEANNDELIKAALPVMKRDGFTKIAVVYANYAWGRDAKDVTYRYAGDYGMKILGDVPVETGASEVTAEVAKVKALGPQALLVWTLTKEQAGVARARAALGWNIPTYSPAVTALPAMKIAGPAAFEGYRVFTWADPKAPEVVEIIERFKKQYGYTPPDTGYFMGTYAATLVQINILKTMVERNIPLTRANVRDAAEKYSEGVQIPIPTPRKSRGWAKVPHLLLNAEDFITLEIRGGDTQRLK